VRIASFGIDGRSSFGVVDGETIIDLGQALPDLESLDAVLDAGALVAVREAVEGGDCPRVAFTDVQLELPVSGRRIFCIGINYSDHREEMGREKVPFPTVFVRFASSVVAHDVPIERPVVSEFLDWEGELAVVIGRRGRHISAADALSHIAGYSVLMDGSVRDWQRQTSQFTAGKNFDRSGSFGPWLVTTDEVPDPSALELTTRVNGVVMQHSTTDLLIHDVPALVEYLSAFTELQPGDVIATGTPGGVGFARTPPIWLVPGDVVEVDISSVGVLRNHVIAEIDGSGR
jgi:2-keto-4-pentenoate hydratase/2-oxohepta-3-ene-1,7-dioic acid hydratase in catechol pathway